MKKQIKIEIETESNITNDMLKASMRWRLRNFRINKVEVEDIKEEYNKDFSGDGK